MPAPASAESLSNICSRTQRIRAVCALRPILSRSPSRPNAVKQVFRNLLISKGLLQIQ